MQDIYNDVSAPAEEATEQLSPEELQRVTDTVAAITKSGDNVVILPQKKLQEMLVAAAGIPAQEETEAAAAKTPAEPIPDGPKPEKIGEAVLLTSIYHKGHIIKQTLVDFSEGSISIGVVGGEPRITLFSEIGFESLERDRAQLIKLGGNPPPLPKGAKKVGPIGFLTATPKK